MGFPGPVTSHILGSPKHNFVTLPSTEVKMTHNRMFIVKRLPAIGIVHYLWETTYV